MCCTGSSLTCFPQRPALLCGHIRRALTVDVGDTGIIRVRDNTDSSLYSARGELCKRCLPSVPFATIAAAVLCARCRELLPAGLQLWGGCLRPERRRLWASTAPKRSQKPSPTLSSK
jgi:hypothetical protein